MSGKQEKNEKPWLADGRNIVIVLLVIVSLVQGFLLFRRGPDPDLTVKKSEPAVNATLAEGGDSKNATLAAGSGDEANATIAEKPTEPQVAPEPEPETGPQKVTISGVTLESEQRRFLLMAFDKPVGLEQVGKILDTPPFSIYPELRGVWSWISPYTLRMDFEEPLGTGKDYSLTVDADKLNSEAYELTGDTDFSIRTYDFTVNTLSLEEDFSSEKKGSVYFKGQVEFTYEVDPKALIGKLACYRIKKQDQEPVMVELTTSYRTRWFDFRTAPLEKDLTPSTLHCQVEAGLPSASGKMHLAKTFYQEYTMQLDPDLKVLKAEVQSEGATASMRVTFSAPVVPETADRYVHIMPETKHSLSSSGRELVLSGDFEPGNNYTLVVDKGLVAADTSVLQASFETSLFVPNAQPNVAFKDPGIFLPVGGYKNLAVESVNLPKAKLQIDRVYINNIFMMLQDYSSSYVLNTSGYNGTLRHYLGDRVVDKDVLLPMKENKVITSTLDIESYIKDQRPGFYRIFLTAPDEWDSSQRWVLLTDLGIVAKKGQDDVMVWVNSFKTMDPVGQANISLISDQNQLIASGTTDENGLWHARDLAKVFKDNTPYMVLVEKGEDMSFLLFDQFKIDTTGQDVGGETVAKKGYLAYLYGERDLYRPGEKMQGLAIIRQADLKTPPTMPLQVVQKGPQGKVLSKRVLNTDERGIAEFAYDIPGFALTGDYTLDVVVAEKVIGSYRYKVEEFVPDRIKVEIAPGKESFAPGETLKFDVDSRYFFGPPASGLPVESKVRLMAASFNPEGFEAFRFGDPEREFEEQNLAVGSPEDYLDEEGRHAFSVELPRNLTPPAALDAMLFARVSERGGRGVAAMQAVRVHAYPRYPGLRSLEDHGVSPREAVNVDYVVVTPDGTKQDGANLLLEVYRDRWQTVLRHTASGGYRYESVRDSELVSSETLKNAKAEGKVKVTPPKYGSYRIRLSDRDGGATSQVSFYAGGWGYSPWAIENPATLELEPDKEEYAPGETATLQIRTPFAGKMLVTVENEEVQDVQVLELAEGENTAEVRLPMRANYSPNVYVAAVLVRSSTGLESGSPARAFGVTSLNVDRSANIAKVAITAPEQIRPETSLKVELKSLPGACVTLAAVDEGILQLISQKTPDPFPRFYAKRSLQTDSFDIYSMLFPDIKPTIGISPAGGGDDMDRMRQFVRSEGLRRVKPVAFWSGPIIMDDNGEASISFDVPEFQGALRLMAVVNDGKRFGKEERVTRVRGPVVLTPTLPRFLAPGDEVYVPVTVRNDTEYQGSFIVTLELSGPATVENGETTLDVPVGREELVYFKVKAGEESGNVHFKFTASGNNETVESNVDLGIRPALPARTLVNSGALESASTTISLENAEGFRPEGLERELHIGASPLMRFTQGLKNLLGYPYGCLEQTTSQVFPLLYFDALAQALDKEELSDRQPGAMVQQGIQRLLAMQLHTGGFSMWIGGESPWKWGSVYATHFLVEARQAGFQVPDTALNLALNYMKSLMRYKKEPQRSELELNAYALYVLAKAGKPDRGGMDYLRRQYQGALTPEGGALLGAAYGLVGERRFMSELLAAKYLPRTKGRETGGNLASPIRNAALRLAVILETAPDSLEAPKLVQELTTLMEATPYRSTQENGLSFVALGRFFAMQQKKAPFTGSVYLGDTKLGDFSSENTLHKIRIKGDAPLRIEVDSGFAKGSVFFSVLTRGTPKDDAYAAVSEGITVTSRLLDSSGKPIPATGLKQGALVVLETKIKSVGPAIRNVVMQSLLPAGLEVENPRLETTERLPWADRKGVKPDYQDLRDDRVLLFLNLPEKKVKNGKDHYSEQTYYSLLRAVAPGDFALPPVQAEAMYDPACIASGPTGRLVVNPDSPDAVAKSVKTEEPAAASPAEQPVTVAPEVKNTDNSNKDSGNLEKQTTIAPPETGENKNAEAKADAK